GNGPAAVTLPLSFLIRKGNLFSIYIPLSPLVGMGRSLKGQGSQKTCHYGNILPVRAGYLRIKETGCSP
ncbi:MAG: hypothetical protein JSU78_05430, partial [Deltaproteobacteria bacterium]